MKSKLFLLYILFILTLLCCQKEDKQIEVNSGVINPELAPFIESFREEGRNRGLTFTSILNAQIVDDFSEPTYQNQPGLAAAPVEVRAFVPEKCAGTREPAFQNCA